MLPAPQIRCLCRALLRRLGTLQDGKRSLPLAPGTRARALLVERTGQPAALGFRNRSERRVWEGRKLQSQVLITEQASSNRFLGSLGLSMVSCVHAR